MASSKDYLNFVLERLSLLSGVSYRAMMGEYIIYYQEKIIGGIYDDRFLIKHVDTIKKFIQNPTYESPYLGGKEMILVEDIDDKNFLKILIEAIYKELPAPKRKK